MLFIWPMKNLIPTESKWTSNQTDYGCTCRDSGKHGGARLFSTFLVAESQVYTTVLLIIVFTGDRICITCVATLIFYVFNKRNSEGLKEL